MMDCATGENDAVSRSGGGPYCLLSSDVETHSIWLNRLRDETGIKVYEEAMPRLLDLYDRHAVATTFFFTGYVARLVPDVVSMVLDRGHEVGCHGLVHDVDKAYDKLTLSEQVSHLVEAKAFLEEIAGVEVISFRAPALRVNRDTPTALAEAGFRIDSSISPQRMDLFLSFGSWNKFQRLLSPRRPYRTSPDNLARRGSGPIVEVPPSALGLPLVGSTMRVFPRLNRALRRVLVAEAKHRALPVVMYSHPNEFIDESGEPVHRTHRRTTNPIEYLLADVLRRKLKIRNLGDRAFELYEEQIRFFADHGFSFVTTRRYCEEEGLIA